MGKKPLLWEDSWLHDNPICIDHPTLYEICEDKDITVHEVLAKRGHLSFKRWLSPLLFEEWIRQLEQVFSFQFCNQEDIILWKWNCRKKFTTRSVYDYLSSEGTPNSYNHIWKSKLPYKIKIFTWLLEREAVLTKDNMIKRN